MKEEEKNSCKENHLRKYATTSKTDKNSKTKLIERKRWTTFKESYLKYLIIIFVISTLLKGNYSQNITLKIERKGDINTFNGRLLSEISNSSNSNINSNKKINYLLQRKLDLRKIVSGGVVDDGCSSNYPFKYLFSSECVVYCDVNSLILNNCELSYKSGNALYNSFNRSMTDFNINLLNNKQIIELKESYFTFSIINIELINESITNYYTIMNCLNYLEQNSNGFNTLEEKKIILLMINHYNEYNQINKTIYKYYHNSDSSSSLFLIDSSKCNELYYTNNSNITFIFSDSDTEKTTNNNNNENNEAANDNHNEEENENNKENIINENGDTMTQILSQAVTNIIINEIDKNNVIIIIDNNTDVHQLIFENAFSDYKANEGKNIVFKGAENIVYQITNPKNELDLLKNRNNNIHNLSIVDLGECETILKTKYHINENDSLIFIKSETITDKASKRTVNYEVYEPYNKTKLNLSVCDGTPINVYIPVELSAENKQIYEKMKESGYDMFNINDPFYQDICTPFDSANGTDILLSDRINFIYNNDDTQCQPNCQLSQYSLETKYLNCSCSANNEKDTSDTNDKEEKFSAKKIYESFYEVLKYSNYDIIKCYNLLLNINVITINIGSIVVIIYFSCYLICMLIYINRGLIPLRIQLRNDINKNDKIIKKEILNISYPPVKKNHVVKLSINQYNLNNNNNNKKKKKITKKKIFNIDLSNQNDLGESVVVYSNSGNKNLIKNKLNIDKYENIKIKDALKINRNETEKNAEKVYSDYELNELEYIEAVKYDKRSFCQMYWATLKREHLIIFTFFNCYDYNLFAIKLSRFLFLLVGDMALNVFFFSDDSMHKIFLNYGKYDFFQQIPQITYSTIISQIIEVFLCFLSLTDKYI